MCADQGAYLRGFADGRRIAQTSLLVDPSGERPATLIYDTTTLTTQDQIDSYKRGAADGYTRGLTDWLLNDRPRLTFVAS